MTIPRFLARLPYGADTEPLESFSFEEFPTRPSMTNIFGQIPATPVRPCWHRSFLLLAGRWTNGSLRTSTAFRFTFMKAAARPFIVPCAEVQLTYDGCDRLMEFGLMPLVSFKNTDHVKLAQVPIGRRPGHRLARPMEDVASSLSALRTRWQPHSNKLH